MLRNSFQPHHHSERQMNQRVPVISKKIKIASYLLVLFAPMLLSSCFLIDSEQKPILFPQEFTYSSNVGNNLACQIGISSYYYKGSNCFSVYQCMKGDSTMAIKKKNIVVKYHDTETPICALRIPETSKFKKFWKKYWTKENIDWNKVKTHNFSKYAFMKIDFKGEIGLGDSIEIIERDFPHEGDSVVVAIKTPLIFPEDSYFRSSHLDADLQFYRLKKEIEDKQKQ